MLSMVCYKGKRTTVPDSEVGLLKDLDDGLTIFNERNGKDPQEKSPTD
jgi:hypothetical protein